MAHVATNRQNRWKCKSGGREQSSAWSPPTPPKGTSNRILPRQKDEKRNTCIPIWKRFSVVVCEDWGRSIEMERELERGYVKKGPWSREEDEVLLRHVQKYGPREWSSIRSKGLLPRTGKSCRLRWVNKLRPNLKTWVYF